MGVSPPVMLHYAVLRATNGIWWEMAAGISTALWGNSYHCVFYKGLVIGMLWNCWVNKNLGGGRETIMCKGLVQSLNQGPEKEDPTPTACSSFRKDFLWELALLRGGCVVGSAKRETAFGQSFLVPSPSLPCLRHKLLNSLIRECGKEEIENVERRRLGRKEVGNWKGQGFVLPFFQKLCVRKPSVQ